MLCLQRHEGTSIIIKVPPSDREQIIAVTLLEVQTSKRAKLGITADVSIPIYREELLATEETHDHRTGTSGQANVGSESLANTNGVCPGDAEAP